MAVEIHVPNIYGPVQLATDEGLAGQQLTSAGPGAQAIWAASGGITVSDTDTVDLTLTGNDITADVIVSPDAGNQLVAQANGLFVAPAAAQIFTFTSPSATSHTIVHNLGNSFPNVTIWDTASGDVIAPSTVSSNGPNSFDVTFFLARAIAGTVVG